MEHKVELRGRSFNDFMVPPCLDCQKEGRGESSATMVSCFVARAPYSKLEIPPIPIPSSDKTGCHFLWRDNTGHSEEAMVGTASRNHIVSRLIFCLFLLRYSLNDLEACERLLVIGTTLATYSAFRY
jgi:hypothetical protein